MMDMLLRMGFWGFIGWILGQLAGTAIFLYFLYALITHFF